MSSLFVQAANLNNDGINALLQGDHVTAMQFLANAIKLMKQEAIAIVQHQTMAEQTMKNNDDNGNHIFPLERGNNHAGIDVVPSSPSSFVHARPTTSNSSSRTTTSSNNAVGNTMPISHHHHCHNHRHTIEIPTRRSELSSDYSHDTTATTTEMNIFNHAIRISVPISTSTSTRTSSTTTTTTTSDTNSTTGSPNEFDLSICISIIIFNLALTYHIKASSFSSLLFWQQQQQQGPSTTNANKTKNNAAATSTTTASILGNDDGDDRSIIMRKQALCIAKAKNLYTMAIKLLNGGNTNSSYSMVNDYHHSTTALVVKLASINNLLQIRYFSTSNGADHCNHNNKEISHCSNSSATTRSISSSGSSTDHGDIILEQGLNQVSYFFQDSSSMLAQQRSRAMLEDTKIQILLMNIFLFKNFLPVIAAAAA